MSQERRKFDKEFKRMTVELSKNRENLNELAKELGVRVELIYRWRTEFLDKGEGSFPGHGNPKHTQAQLRAKMKRRFKVTTDSKHQYAGSENLLNRNFTATGQAWVSDITYIKTFTGGLYLTVGLDLADRKGR